MNGSERSALTCLDRVPCCITYKHVDVYSSNIPNPLVKSQKQPSESHHCMHPTVMHLQAQQELVMAFAMCLSCIPVKPPAEPNRERYIQHLLHTLPATLQQLAPPPQHSRLTAQEAASATAAADKGLQHLRTLMMFMHSWRDSQPTEQSQASISPAAEAFISCWPLIHQALASGTASDAVQERAAACCTAAVQVHLTASMSAMPGILHVAACGVASSQGTAHLWVRTIAAALDQLENQQLSQLMISVKDSLSMIDSSAPAQALIDRNVADCNPDFAMVSLLCRLSCAQVSSVCKQLYG